MARITDDLPPPPKPVAPKPVQPVIKPATAAPKTAPKGFGPDDLSSGQGGALRRAAVSQLGAQGLSANSSTAAPTGATFKASMLGSLGSASFSKLLDQQPIAQTPGTTAAMSTTVDPAAQAQADVKQLQDSKGGYLAQTDVAGLIAQHPNDPVYAANVVAAVENSGDGAVAATFVDGNATPDEQKLVAAAISQAQSMGLMPADYAQRLGSFNPAAGDTLSSLLSQVGGNPAQAIAQAAASPRLEADAVSTLTEVAEIEKQGVAEAEQELGRLMGKLGPLTDDQKKAFIARYKQDHPEFAAYADAQKNLAGYVGAHQADLTAAAKTDPVAAAELAKAYKSLVGTPEEAQFGLSDPKNRELVAAGLTDKDVIAALGAADPEFASITAPAAADALLEKLGTTEDREGVFTQLHEFVEAYGASGVPGLADSAKSLADSIPKLADALAKLKSGPINRESLGEFWKEWQDISKDAGETSPLGKVFEGAGFALGVLEVTEGVAKQDQGEVLKGFGDTLSSSAAIGYGAEALARWMPDWISEATAKGLTDGLETIGGVASTFIGAISVLQDMGHLDKGSDQAKLVGDSLTTLGGALLLIPGAEEFGVVATIAGTITNFVAGFIAQGEQQALDAKYDGEANQILSQLYALPGNDPGHVDPKLGALLMSLPPDVTQRLTQQLGLSSADWLHAAQSDPDALGALVQQLDQADGNGSLAALAAAGLSGTRLLDLLQANPSMAVMLDDGRYGASVAELQKALNLTPDQLVQTLVRMSQAANGTDEPDVFRQVLNDIDLEGGGENSQAMLAFFRDQAQNGSLGAEYQAVAKAMLGL